VDVTVRGLSIRLFTKDSTGRDGFGGVTVAEPVTAIPGVDIGVDEFGGRNGTG